MSEIFFAASPAEHQKRERTKARELRQSQWWRNRRGEGLCYHCEQKFVPSDLTMDHLIPIARGGKSDRHNCVPCCKECNTQKGHMTRVELVMSKSLTDS